MVVAVAVLVEVVLRVEVVGVEVVTILLLLLSLDSLDSPPSSLILFLSVVDGTCAVAEEGTGTTPTMMGLGLWVLMLLRGL